MTHLHPSSADLTSSPGSLDIGERRSHPTALESADSPKERCLLTDAEVHELRWWVQTVLRQPLQFDDPKQEEIYLHGWKMQLQSHHPD